METISCRQFASFVSAFRKSQGKDLREMSTKALKWFNAEPHSKPVTAVKKFLFQTPRRRPKERQIYHALNYLERRKQGDVDVEQVMLPLGENIYGITKLMFDPLLSAERVGRRQLKQNLDSFIKVDFQ